MSDEQKQSFSTSQPIDGFDDAEYLRLNPDVAKAVQSGAFESGWHHYVQYGFREGRPGVPWEAEMPIDDGRPLPPERLRLRAHGDISVGHFMKVGTTVAKNVHDAIEGKLVLGPESRVLDFGCGCGRVIQNLVTYFPKSHFYGSDIDAEAIQWCQNNLSSISEFVTNEIRPPLPFPDKYFDLTYCISVFTHLPEDMQFAWLAELRRVMKPGAYAVLTTHGANLLEGNTGAQQALERQGIFYSVGPGTEGLPDFYQTTFHSEKYIRTRWSKFFKIERIISRGIANHQDLILCRKRHPFWS